MDLLAIHHAVGRTMQSLETDYLVVGAGAVALAFVDALIESSADQPDVVLVDRRPGPGGHWNDAYSFVRLHQPSAFYGVNSRHLGTDRFDASGPNAGSYERATGGEVLEYFNAVLSEQLLPSGQVRFFGETEYEGGAGKKHRIVSLADGVASEVTVRRALVDATYLSSEVPATHVPGFSVDADARVIPVNQLPEAREDAERYTVIGGGKTSMDACTWLLESGVEASAIRWVRSRDAWLLDREFQQPLDMSPQLIEGISLWMEAAAEAESVPDLFERLEACGQLLRLDPNVQPDMYRCATISRAEVEQLALIENVVRAGRVKSIAPDRLELEQDSVATEAGTVHVDCTAAGITRRPAKPVFSDDLITIQASRMCQPTINAAMAGHIEATRDDVAEKNELFEPNPYPDHAIDWIQTQLIAQRVEAKWSSEPDLAKWLASSRLNISRDVRSHIEEPRVQAAMARIGSSLAAGGANLAKFADQVASQPLGQ